MAVLCFSLILLKAYVKLDKLRPDGAFRWKAKHRQLGRSKSVMWQAGTSKVVAPASLSVTP
jgi:hypothetical protein